jgi:hypothetical protein
MKSCYFTPKACFDAPQATSWVEEFHTHKIFIFKSPAHQVAEHCGCAALSKLALDCAEVFLAFTFGRSAH